MESNVINKCKEGVTLADMRGMRMSWRIWSMKNLRTILCIPDGSSFGPGSPGMRHNTNEQGGTMHALPGVCKSKRKFDPPPFNLGQTFCIQ